MGKIKYINDIRDFFKKNIIVDINSLKRFIQKERRGEKYVHQIVHNMIEKREIKRITSGYYSIYDDPIISVFCFKPSYIGLQSALSIHDLWEQETIPVILTTRKIRQGVRDVAGSNIILHRISSRYFFGIEYKKEGDIHIPVSDLEKTFIDMLYFKQKIGSDLLKEFKKRMDKEKLKKYAKRYHKVMFSRTMGALE